MHLAALGPQTPHVSTYFVGCVGVVGGVPPVKEKALMTRTKKCLIKSHVYNAAELDVVDCWL